jgi:hypothetical protein
VRAAAVVPWAAKKLATHQTSERRFGMTNILVRWAGGINQTGPVSWRCTTPCVLNSQTVSKKQLRTSRGGYIVSAPSLFSLPSVLSLE